MKKPLVITALTLAALLFSGSLPCKKQLLAVSGCCKARNSLTSDWRKIAGSFEDCKGLNEETDRDDVFDEEGLVWWDVTC